MCEEADNAMQKNQFMRRLKHLPRILIQSKKKKKVENTEKSLRKVENSMFDQLQKKKEDAEANKQIMAENYPELMMRSPSHRLKCLSASQEV